MRRCDRRLAAVTAVEQLQVAPVPASIANPEGWREIAEQIASESGLPTQVTPELMTGMIASAVPLLFEADAAGDMSVLRGTFTDAVIAQRRHTAGCFAGERPSAATIELIGAHMAAGHPTIRAHVSIQTRTGDGTQTVNNQFWDLQLDAQVTVGRPSCPNCGAPVAAGHLICEHCQADLRSVVKVPLAVSRLELY
jgi:hypothetical protein